ncbi:hypothetical protein JS520_00025 [Candidatus Vidania fulgoroideae]|nr:hypothetical protein JS520_00025 [Candidatus Vidania fulgoroideae]
MITTNHKAIAKVINTTTHISKKTKYLILTTYNILSANTLQHLKLNMHAYAKIQLIKTTAANLLIAKNTSLCIKNTILICYTNNPIKTISQLSKHVNIKIQSILFKNKPLTATQIKLIQQVTSKTELLTKIILFFKKIIIALIKLIYTLKK